MRTRLIRPEFWSDTTMAKLAPEVRLTYMGLWCLADDAGYLEWDAEQLAGELYRHENPAERLERVSVELEVLLEAGRVRLLGCGRHALVPTIPDYRIRGGEQLYTVKKRHDRRCSSSTSVGLRSSTESSVSVSVSGSGSDMRASAHEEELEAPPPAGAGEAAWIALGQQLGGVRRNGH
jgi:hypothetical protein